MSVVAGGLYLILKLFSGITTQYLTPSWHYYTYAVIYMFFLLPYHKLLSLFHLSFSQNAENGLGLPTLPSIVELPLLGSNDFVAATDKAGGVSTLNLDFLPYLLVAGTLVFIVVILIQNIKLYRRIFSVCRLEDDAQFRGILARCKQEMGISKKVSVYTSPYASTPFLYGILKPRIVLPDIEFTTEELQHVFYHELTHWKRRDPWLKCLMLLMNAVHWFNPLAYIARYDIDRFCELSCDESVVISMNTEERRQYCELILNVLWHAAGHNVKLFSAFSDKRKQLERRMNMIMKIEGLKSKKWVHMFAIAMLLVLVLAGSVAVYAANENDDNRFSKDVALSVESLKSEQPLEKSNLPLSDEKPLQLVESDVKLEVLENTSMDFSIMASFPISSSSLPPNSYTRSSSSYYINSGVDKLQFSANWNPTGQQIQIGFVNASNSSIQYWTSAYSGGSASGTVSTSSVPSGEYYVAIGTPSSNTQNISVNGTFEWQ
ncbi:MAG: M56 family metallopeptidase [Thermincola sp.]|jgi:beta-lactamase regulating signal transducer with metallopeptidase domain|nr:M56 family metallopeptidase [Thermincola sp.]